MQVSGKHGSQKAVDVSNQSAFRLATHGPLHWIRWPGILSLCSLQGLSAAHHHPNVSRTVSNFFPTSKPSVGFPSSSIAQPE